jgi:hypothetical protein
MRGELRSHTSVAFPRTPTRLPRGRIEMLSASKFVEKTSEIRFAVENDKNVRGVAKKTQDSSARRNVLILLLHLWEK